MPSVPVSDLNARPHPSSMNMGTQMAEGKERMILVKRIIVMAIGFICLTATAKADDQNVFSNPTLGFSVTKPANWHVASTQDFFRNLKLVELDDKQFQDQLQKYAQVPFLAFMKYPEPYDDVNPSFKVNVKPLAQLGGKDPKEILQMLVPVFKNAFRDFRTVDGPKDITIDGIPSAYAMFQYTLSVADGRTFPTTSDIFIIPRGNIFFMVGVGSRQDASQEDLIEIDSIIQSIKIQQN